MSFLSKTAHTAKFASKSQKDRKITKGQPNHKLLANWHLARAGVTLTACIGAGAKGYQWCLTCGCLASTGFSHKIPTLGSPYFPYAFPFKNSSYGKVCPKISKRQENQKTESHGGWKGHETGWPWSGQPPPKI